MRFIDSFRFMSTSLSQMGGQICPDPPHPVIFHNLSNYDAHLLIKKIFIKNPKERLECIPNNEEKYIFFSNEIVLGHITDEEGDRKPVKREIRFIDSFRFMSTSLDALIKNLDPEQCKNLKKFYSDPRKFDLLKKKVFIHMIT